jgi:hypothetical protein
MHLSSPRDGWGAPNPRPHADYVDPADVPAAWLRLAAAGRRFTVDVEAKDKERAVLAIRDAIAAALSPAADRPDERATDRGASVASAAAAAR